MIHLRHQDEFSQTRHSRSHDRPEREPEIFMTYIWTWTSRTSRTRPTIQLIAGTLRTETLVCCRTSGLLQSLIYRSFNLHTNVDL